MSQYLTLSRAARLVGVKRGVLQQRISAGELPTFEGKIELSALLRLYPQTQVEDSSERQRVERIKQHAVPRLLTGAMPDIDTLSSRAVRLSEELAQAQHESKGYERLIAEVQRRLARMRASEAELQQLQAWLGEALTQCRAEARQPDQLLVRDSVMRIMTAHVVTYPSEHEFFVEGRESLLEAGLRAGLALNYGCSDASCGLCRARCLAGKTKRVRSEASLNLSPPLQAAELLMCCHTAVTDVELDVLEAQTPADLSQVQVQCGIRRIDRPDPGVAILNLTTPPAHRLRFVAGQYARLQAPDGREGTYAIASCPCEDRRLQFHVADHPDDGFARYVFDRLKLGDAIGLRGPAGEFWLDQSSPRSLLFIAWDSGFGAVKSLIENAMAWDTAERIDLVWYTETLAQPYLDNLCRSWQDAFDHFHYHSLHVRRDGTATVEHLVQDLNDQLGNLDAYDCYLSASESVAAAFEKHLRARGFPQGQLHVDLPRPAIR